MQSVDILSWVRRHARDLVWDDTDRKGGGPKHRRSKTDLTLLPDVGDDEAPIVPVRCRPRHRSALPRFNPHVHLLTPEAYARGAYDVETERIVARQMNEARLYSRGDVRRDHEGRDGGWARPVGTRTADVLLTRRRAHQRSEDELDAFVEVRSAYKRVHGRESDANIPGPFALRLLRDLERLRLISKINDAIYLAYPLDKTIVASWSIRSSIRYLRFFLERPSEHPETALKRIADGAGTTVEFTRAAVAMTLDDLRPFLVDVAGKRTGHGIGSAKPLHINFTAWPALKNGGKGRPRAHDPKLVRVALFWADLVHARLYLLTGGMREELRPTLAGVAFHIATALLKMPPVSIYNGVVLASRLFDNGRRPQPKRVAREVAAHQLGLPVEALDAYAKAVASA